MGTKLIVGICSAMILAFSVVGSHAEEVEYEVTFDATWSAATHPDDFPVGSAHFSRLVGGVHNSSVSFWQAGELATLGTKNMAERGIPDDFAAEMSDDIPPGDVGNVFIDSSGLSPSPGTRTLSFQTSSAHPLVTLVTMIAPSPDWFVGVSGLSLRDDDGWLPLVEAPLVPYDAGTDSATTFIHDNTPTVPWVPISQITGFPFENAPPLGTFTFRLIPEPSTFMLLSMGTLSLLAFAWRRRRRR